MDLMKLEYTVLKKEACRYEARSVFVSLFRIITESECSDIGWNTVNTDLYWVLGLYICFALVMKYLINYQLNLSFLVRSDIHLSLRINVSSIK